jgi:hypothetical protein
VAVPVSLTICIAIKKEYSATVRHDWEIREVVVKESSDEAVSGEAGGVAIYYWLNRRHGRSGNPRCGLRFACHVRNCFTRAGMRPYMLAFGSVVIVNKLLKFMNC